MEFPKKEFIQAFGMIERGTRKGRKTFDKIKHSISLKIIKFLKRK